MKPSDFKKIIKEAVKEAIQEELKDILLEAVRAPKTIVTESIRDTYAQPHLESPKKLTAAERQAIDTLLRRNCDQQTVAADSGNIDQTNVGKGMLQQQA